MGIRIANPKVNTGYSVTSQPNYMHLMLIMCDDSNRPSAAVVSNSVRVHPWSSPQNCWRACLSVQVPSCSTLITPKAILPFACVEQCARRSWNKAVVYVVLSSILTIISDCLPSENSGQGPFSKFSASSIINLDEKFWSQLLNDGWR